MQNRTTCSKTNYFFGGRGNLPLEGGKLPLSSGKLPPKFTSELVKQSEREKSPFLSPALYPLSLPTRDAPPILFRVLKRYKTCSSLPSLATLLTLFGEYFEGSSVSSSERPSSVSSIFEVVSSFCRSIHSIVVRSSFDRSFLTILSIK